MITCRRRFEDRGPPGGVESRENVTGRTSAATADALGLPLTEFPSHHGGFLGNDHGQGGDPEAFAARLREVLDDAAG